MWDVHRGTHALSHHLLSLEVAGGNGGRPILNIHEAETDHAIANPVQVGYEAHYYSQDSQRKSKA